MLCVDNSEYMRNGDYAPTRLEAQAETVSYIANAKLNDNQESEVGLMSMAGNRVDVHCSMCREIGTIMTCIQKEVVVGGSTRLVDSLKVAQLALKNRQNKNQKQRIIVFVGSPVQTPTKELVQLGKRFKKNMIAVDVINFGAENSENENAEKLEAFVAAVNRDTEKSTLLNVPPGPHILSDLVLSSAIMVDTAQVGAAVGGMGAMGGDAGGVDEDLAMAIRMSMEDERQRQEREAGGAGATAAATTTASTASTPLPVQPDAGAMMDDDDELDEDALLAQAIAMSMEEENLGGPPKAETPVAAAAATTAEGDAPGGEDIAAALQDKDFMENLLASVPGGDDMAIDDILSNLANDEDKEKKDKK